MGALVCLWDGGLTLSAGPLSDDGGRAGGGAVSSACDGVHGDGVLGSRTQAGDGGCGLGARHSELFGWAALSCRTNQFRARR